MKRSTTTVRTIPASCNNYRQFYSDPLGLNEYKGRYLNISALGNYINTTAASDFANQSRDGAELRLRTNRDFLNSFETNMEAIQNCISEELLVRQEYANQIYDVQQDVSVLQTEVEEKEAIAKDAKERAMLLARPYDKTTRYEGWFPIGRPLKQNSVPVLMGLAIFILIFSLGLFFLLLTSPTGPMHGFTESISSTFSKLTTKRIA